MRVTSQDQATQGARGLLYVLFGLSGFAGLIYESIWSHYLKLFLGHAAYAQTLVLCIFMGGMAIGAWLVGLWSSRIRHPLLAYAAVEGVLGLAALCFDPVFRAVQFWVFDALIPQFSSPVSIDLAKWTVAAAIILPQSILLGATFPLMSAGLVRLFPAGPGRALGWLYFTNSMGAALGVLASGFFLVGWVGLPGTSLTAGLINFVLAISVYLLARSSATGRSAHASATARSSSAGASGLLLIVAALTGAASFFYEIAWIRMLSLVIGAATHSFELMLSSFITGLALGSFYIRSRIDGSVNARLMLGWIQVIMGGLALLSIPLYLGLFDAMAWWLNAIDRNAAGYQLFTAFAYGLCFLLMLPATFCAGMTLPLITSTLMREGGERAIGRVYAANTLGSILGVILAVHLVMPVLGLRAVLITGAAIDIVLGVYLLSGQASLLRRQQRAALALAAVPCLAIVLLVRFDPQITSSGVFRTNDARSPDEILFHRDGKTATVDVGLGSSGNTYISTNGKVDAALKIGGKATLDDHTMILLGLLPLSHLPRAEQVAVIGMGSGRSTHALLNSKILKEVHTIEIEPAMVEGAKLFGPETVKTFTDPRSIIHIEDAKTFFARSGRQYDLIISEPSNPWVSGVSSLFSQEFYQQTQRYLAPGGLFIQWFHLYEIDIELATTVINAVGSSFSDYVVYATNNADIIIVAAPSGIVPALTDDVLRRAEFTPLLGHLGIRTLADFQIRRVGGKETLAPLARAINPVANSDYFPVLDQGAAKRRYMSSNAIEFLELHPYSSRLETGSARLRHAIAPVEGQPHSDRAANARLLGDYAAMREGLAVQVPDDIHSSLRELYFNLSHGLAGDCHPDNLRSWLGALRALTMLYAPYIQTTAADAFLKMFRDATCYAKLDEESRLWVQLFQGISHDDWAVTQRGAESMLALFPKKFVGSTFVITELLLADLKANGAPRARQRLKELESRLPQSFPLLYLRTNIGV